MRRDDTIVRNGGKGWSTKSGGLLKVPVHFSLMDAEDYLYGGNPKSNLRGFRLYMVSDLLKGAVGAGEFHRERTEIIVIVTGSIELVVENLNGIKRSFELKAGDSAQIPPLTLHTYVVQADKTILIVLANTRFEPDDERTFDSFSAEEFQKLKLAQEKS